jgi:hypothetical protein
MSNLFKKLSIAALVIVGSVVVSVASVNAQTTSSTTSTTTTTTTANYVFTRDLTVGSRGADVSVLQSYLIERGYLHIVAPTGYFGSLTKAAVASWQASVGISPAVGYFGPISRARLNAILGVSYPAGCSSNSGFSQTTGLSCASTTTTTTTTTSSYPAGCTSSAGYSTTTGQSCAVVVGYPAGCTSSAGYSPTTGVKCDSAMPVLPAGCTSTVGYSSTTGTKCDSTSTSTTTTTTTTTTSTAGGAGSIDDVEEISSLSDEEVAEGDSDVKVAGYTITSDDGSDLAITAVRLSFDLTAGAGSDDLNDYADSVSVWMGSTRVGSADVSNFSDDSDNAWNETINLSSAAMVDAGDSEDFFVTVDALANIDSDDLGANTWTLTLEEVRFRDEDGATIADSTTGDLPAEVEFSFETLATAGDVELEVSLTSGAAADAINESHVVEIDGDTDDVSILAFDLEATGDITDITNIPLTIIANGTGDVDEIASSFSLWMDGERIDTVDVASGTAENFNTTETEVAACAGNSCTINFDDVNFDLDDGDVANFIVKADFNEVDGTDFVGGDSLIASLGAGAVDEIEAEDANGDDLEATELTGTAVAEDVYGYEVAFTFDLVSTSAVRTASGVALTPDSGTYTIKFELTAFGGDVSISGLCEETTTNGSGEVDEGVVYTLTGNTDVTCDLSSTANVNPADAADFIILEGESEEFTLTVVAEGADDISKVYLNSINFDSTSTDTSVDEFFSAGLGEQETSTSSVFLDDNA